MTNIKEADFFSTFPAALKQDKKMYALGKLISEELHITANKAEENIIYTRIDSLPEKWLDMLAYDLHVDWYDYDYPAGIKRELLKNSIKVHQKLGTKYAVQTVLQDVYKTAKIEEWFEYGGRPYTFRITADVGNSGMSGDMSYEIERKMQFYKNLRSHCEGIFYSLSPEIAVAKLEAVLKTCIKIKVKPLLQKKIEAEAKQGIKEVPGIGVTLKVKPLLDKKIDARAGKDVTANSQALNSIKVKPLLDKRVDARAGEDVIVHSQTLNSIKIKPLLDREITARVRKNGYMDIQKTDRIKIKNYRQDELSMGMDMPGNIKTYYKSRQTLTVKREE